MRDILGYEGYYKITEDGKVFSVRSNRFLKLNHKKNGYVVIELNVKGIHLCYRVHRLVAEAYIPNPENKPTVNHINCCKSDNRVCNLEWATISENTKHAFDNGLIVPPSQMYYTVSNINETIVANGYSELIDITGYGSSQLNTYINNNEPLKRGLCRGYIISKVL